MFNKTRQKELTETGKSELYTDLTKLIIKIADYIFRREEAIGQVQGETRLGSLITRLLQDQRTEEIPIVSTDAKRREQLYKEYHL